MKQIIRFLFGALDPAFDFVWDIGFLIAKVPRLRYRIPDLAIVRQEDLSESVNKDAVYAEFIPIAVVEVLSPSNRKGNVAQLLEDYRDLGVEEIVFLDPAWHLIQLNGNTVAENRFTIAGVTIEMDRIW